MKRRCEDLCGDVGSSRAISLMWKLEGGRANVARLKTMFAAVAAGSDTEVLCPVEARRPTEAKTTTFSDGYLGSSIDEGRSEV